MKNFTSWLHYFARQSINQSIWLISTLLLIFSCTKDTDGDFREANPTVKRAKEYYLSTGIPLKFYSNSGTKSIGGDNSFEAQWEYAKINKHKDYLSVEIPLQNSLCETATDDKGKEYKVTSRLIIQYNTKTQKYKQFISTKIWLGEIPDLSTFLFSDLSAASYTLIYDLAGKITSLHKTENGVLLPLILNPDFSNDGIRTISINNEAISFYSFKPIKTKRFESTGYCRRCSGSKYNYVCVDCGRLTPMETNFESFFENIIIEVSTIILHTMNDYYCETQYGSECYNRMADLFIQQVSMTSTCYLLLIDLQYVSNGFIPYSYPFDMDFYMMVTGETPNPEGGVTHRNEYNDLVIFLYEHGHDYCSWLKDYGDHVEEHPVDGAGNGSGGGNGNPETGGEDKEEDDKKKCTDTKCPICSNCFVGVGNPYNCIECTQKELHLLQYDIIINCPNVSDIFSIRDQFLAVRPFYKWESVELSLERMILAPIGIKVYSAVSGSASYTLYEAEIASISGTQIGLPKDLLINRNTERLSATFFHELFHSKQSISPDAKANAEVEAKIAKLIFAEQSDISPWDTEYNEAFYIVLCELRSRIDESGYIVPAKLDEYNYLYKLMLNYLEINHQYPADNSINGDQSLQTLRLYI